MSSASKEILNKTKLAFLWMNIVDEPFMVLFGLLLFILRKDLNASALQISIFATIKPVISLFSFYWSSNLTKKRHKLLSNMISAWVFARIPFLLIFFMNNVWYIIFSTAVFQLFYRAGIPAQMEIAKKNILKDQREKLFSYIFVLRFAESILMGIFLGRLLDMHHSIWKYAFFGFSLLSISSYYIQRKIPIYTEPHKIDYSYNEDIKSKIVRPWKDFINLMKSRPDFSHFQWCFMIGGFGLMLMVPATAIYYAEILNLTHEDISIARCIWMGIGVIASSFFWQKNISKLPIYKLTGIIIAGFSLFPLSLLFASFNHMWLNIAFLFYGIAQSGSHLLWNLSGTMFSNSNEDSSKYTSVNVLTVGIRGAIAPVLGGLLCTIIGSVYVLILGCSICLLGAIFSLGIKKYTSYVNRKKLFYTQDDQ